VSLKRLKKGPVAIIDCPEEIPCNPCETICPSGAIKVGQPITNIPLLDEEKCTGCGRCLPICPGLAISILNYRFRKDEAALTVPYELLPLPEPGETVMAVDRQGRQLTEGKIVRLIAPEKNQQTALVTFSFPRKFYRKVCYFKRKRNHTP